MRLAQGLAALAAAALFAPGLAGAQPAPSKPSDAPDPAREGSRNCVYLNQLQGNHAINDHAVVFRANVSDFYRLDFAGRCPELNYPNPRLIITPFGGNGLICRAIDIDVKVSEQGPGAIAVPCITKSFVKLTPAEVAALPKKDLP